MTQVYFLEDNELILEAASAQLRHEGFQVKTFTSCRSFIQAVQQTPPTLAIMDIMLPDGNSLDMASQLRENYALPFIFLSARTSEEDRIRGLEFGAEDYIVKPFSMKELVLRTHAVAKRVGKKTSEDQTWIYEGQEILHRKSSRQFYYQNKEVPLTAAEYNVLLFLTQSQGLPCSREKILTWALGYKNQELDTRSVDTHVKNIRNKWGLPGLIKTSRGQGYLFCGTKK